MLAVGEHLWGRVDDTVRRISTGFAGGLGCSQLELCGALSGGTLLLGAVYGRTLHSQDDSQLMDKTCAYRERFLRELGATQCAALRARGFGSEGIWPCSNLVERATRILLDLL